jgi:SAM-dependent methyltransferase
VTEQPTFNKPDRYKASSYRTYNESRLETYDSCIWLRIFRVQAWDRCVAEELGADFADRPGHPKHPVLPELRILDVGCATGRLLAYLAAEGATRLAGCDLAPRIVEVARRKLAARGVAADLQPADAEDHLPWPDGAFDAVILSGVLHHFFRPRDALAELHRVVTVGGRLVVTEPWFRPPLRQIANAVLAIVPISGDCRFYTQREVMDLMEERGWTPVRQQRIWPWGFMVVGIKQERDRVDAMDGPRGRLGPGAD